MKTPRQIHHKAANEDHKADGSPNSHSRLGNPNPVPDLHAHNQGTFVRHPAT